MSAEHLQSPRSADMTSEPNTATILAIATDNTWAHWYTTVDDLLRDNDIGIGPNERTGPVEFFDSEGRRLATSFDTCWQLSGLIPTLERPDPDAVKYRLEQVVLHIESFMRRHPEELARYGLLPDEALELVPNLAGLSLFDSLARFAGNLQSGDFAMSQLSDEDEGGWFHNLKHRCGWNHD